MYEDQSDEELVTIIQGLYLSIDMLKDCEPDRTLYCIQDFVGIVENDRILRPLIDANWQRRSHCSEPPSGHCLCSCGITSLRGLTMKREKEKIEVSKALPLARHWAA